MTCASEFRQRVLMRLTTLTLEDNRTIPGQGMTLQAEGNGFEASFVVTRWINIVNAQVPLAPM